MAQTARIDLSQKFVRRIDPARGFRELDASMGDIIAMSATSITIRRCGWLSFVCQIPCWGRRTGTVCR